MSLDIFWFLPTSGDTRYLGRADAARPLNNAYLKQIAVAVDQPRLRRGFDSHRQRLPGPWVTASTVATVTQRIGLLVALRTALTQPTAAARQAATLDQVSNGRLLVNVVAGGDAIEPGPGTGFSDHDARHGPSAPHLAPAAGWRDGEFLANIHGERRAQFLPAGQTPHPAFILWAVAGGA